MAFSQRGDSEGGVRMRTALEWISGHTASILAIRSEICASYGPAFGRNIWALETPGLGGSLTTQFTDGAAHSYMAASTR